jgi:hypothetical protein
MKTISAILLSLLFLQPTGLSAGNMSLNDAVKSGLVKTTIILKSEYDQPLRASVLVENLTQFPIKVELEQGRTLEPGDPEKQTVIVSEPMVFALNGREKKGSKSNVYCIQKHDSSPSETIMTLSEMAPEALIRILRIAKESPEFYSPQNAIWCLTDDLDPTEIESENVAIDKRLRDYVSNVTGNQGYFEFFENPVRNVSVSTGNTTAIQPMASGEESGSRRTLHATFDVALESMDKVEIAAFDVNGNKVEDIQSYARPLVGEYHFNLTSTSEAFNEPVWVKVTQNGETLSEKFFE